MRDSFVVVFGVRGNAQHTEGELELTKAAINNLGLVPQLLVQPLAMPASSDAQQLNARHLSVAEATRVLRRSGYLCPCAAGDTARGRDG